MILLFASDHAGFETKNFLIKKAQRIYNKYIISDLGTNNESSSDYPVYAKKLAHHIKNLYKKGYKKEEVFGVLICGSGIGISIAANRFKHIRAALSHNVKYAKLARTHNDANVLVIGSRMISKKKSLEILRIFLSTEYTKEEKHQKRVNMLG